MRVTGPGLRSGGLVLARSSSCGTDGALVVHGDSGTLPPATLASAPTSWTSSNCVLATAPVGNGYLGSDTFWNALRGRAPNGQPWAVALFDPPTPVPVATIPPLARYQFEVFTVAGGSTPAARFHARIAGPLVGPEFGNRLPWATLSAASTEYADPAVTAKAGELSSVTLSWTPSPDGASVQGAALIGTNGNSRMLVAGEHTLFGSSPQVSVAQQQRNGLGQACGGTTVPAFTATQGSRSVILMQTTDQVMAMRQQTVFVGRPAPL